MRKSVIDITEAAYKAAPDLPRDPDAIQHFKNWILNKARKDNPEPMAILDEVGTKDDCHVLDFAHNHFHSLGLQVLIFRRNGVNVRIDAADSFKEGMSGDLPFTGSNS